MEGEVIGTQHLPHLPSEPWSLQEIAVPGNSSTFRPPCPEFDGRLSVASLCVESGPGMTLWCAGAETLGEATSLQLQPGQCAVIGRQEGGENEYLDPRFIPTQMVPDTGQRVVSNTSSGPDRYVSRGHFTLRGAGHGIVLVNGVPRRGGGIRPPKNGTIMVWPTHRSMGPGEELLIETGDLARIRLPNGTVISIVAE